MEPIHNYKTEQSNKCSTGRVTLYTLMKSDYDKFIAKMEKSDFKNAYTRYISERSLLLSLKECAEEENLIEESDKITARLSDVDKELAKRGIKFSAD